MADIGAYPMEVQALLWSATRAREGRDRWRTVGRTLWRLRQAGVSYREIREHTGIGQGTAHRLVLSGSRTRTTTGST